MPKATKKSFRQNVSASEPTTPKDVTQVKISNKDEDDHTKSLATLSKGQRKRQAKRDQYLRREKLILSSLTLKKEQQQKKRIDGLDAIRKALKATVVTKSVPGKQQKQPPNDKLTAIRVETNKAKQKVTTEEVTHMNLVLQHPAFQKDPFETIREHLKNTLADQAQDQQIKSEEQTKQNIEKDAAKKKAKKERLQEHGGKHRKKYKAARRTKAR